MAFPLDLLEHLPISISNKRNELEPIDYIMLYGERDDDVTEEIEGEVQVHFFKEVSWLGSRAYIG